MIQWSVKRTRGDVWARAISLAEDGELEGTVVAQQRAGAKDVEFSVILRPPPGSSAKLLSLIAVFCTSEGIRKDTGVITWIRWPDSIVVERSVVARAAVTYSPGPQPGWVVISSRTHNKSSTKNGETSLQDVLGTDVEGTILMGKILESLAWMYLGFSRGLDAHILKRVRSMVDTIGRRVEVVDDGILTVGIAKDIDEQGRLLVELKGEKSIMVEPGAQFREF